MKKFLKLFTFIILGIFVLSSLSSLAMSDTLDNTKIAIKKVGGSTEGAKSLSKSTEKIDLSTPPWWHTYLITLGTQIVIAIGFAIAVGLAIWLFDLITYKIDPWEEIKNNNIGVSLIISALVVMTGFIILGIGVL